MVRTILKAALARFGYELVHTRRRTYGGEWDAYVRAAQRRIAQDAAAPGGAHDPARDAAAGDRAAARIWPGDEWADPADWERIFRALLADRLPPSTTRLVEIGQGSGKYSEKVVRHFPAAELLCADVSDAFLQVLAERLAPEVAAGRVEGLLLDQRDPRQLLAAIERRGWLGQLDALYSIDAMVHVDLQIQFAYWLTAAEALRPGGLLALTLADPTTDDGFAKLLADVSVYFPQQGIPSHKFEWLCPELVQVLLTRLGFERIEIARLRPRDLYITATLARRPQLRW